MSCCREVLFGASSMWNCHGRYKAVASLIICGLSVATPTAALAQNQPTSAARSVQLAITDSTGRSVPNARVVRITPRREWIASEGMIVLRVEGRTQIVVSAVGFEPESLLVTSSDPGMRVVMSPIAKRLQGVIVKSQAADVGVVSLSSERARDTPPLVETDVLRSLTLLPHVTRSGDLRGNVHLAAAAGDETQYSIDGFPLHEPLHFFGLLGSLNAAALDRADVSMGYQSPKEHQRNGGIVNLVPSLERSGSLTEATLSVASASFTDVRGSDDLRYSSIVSARKTFLGPFLRATAGAGLIKGDDYNGVSDFHDWFARFRKRSASAYVLDFLSFGSTDRSVLSNPPRYGELLTALRARYEGSRLEWEAALSHNHGWTKSGPSLLDNQRDWTSAHAHVSVSEGSKALALGIRADFRDNRHFWDQTGSTESFWTPDVPRFLDRKQHLHTNTLYLEYSSGALGQRQYKTAIAATMAPRSWNWSGAASFKMPLRDAVSLEAGISRRLQYDYAIGAIGDLGLPPPLLLTSKPRTSSVVFTSLNVGKHLIGIRGVTGASSLSLFVRQADAMKSMDLPGMPECSNAEPHGFCQGLVSDSLERRAWGMSLTSSVSTRRLFASVGYAYQRAFEMRPERGRLPTAWDTPHILTGTLKLALSESLALSGTLTARSGIPAEAVTAVVPVPGVGGMPPTARLITSRSADSRLEGYRRFDVGLQKAFGIWGADAILQLQVVNATDSTNVQEFDFARVLCDVDPACSVKSVAAKKGLPTVPSVGITIRW